MYRRLLVAATAVLVAATSAACNSDSTAPAEAIPMDQQEWAASLGVTLSQFTRLTSGVYFLDTTVGTGTAVSGTPTVKVAYAGYLPNGTKFNENTAGVCFPLNNLIPGWQVGLQGMKVTGTRRLLIPPEYGYGAAGNGPVPGNANLLFNITLQQVGC